MPTLTISYNTRKIEILGRNATRSKHPSHVLHTAAIFGDIKLTAAALASGQPVNAFYDGITPLHAAARAGKATVVHMLIGAGAYVNTGRLPSRPQVGQEGDSGDATDFRTAWRDGYVGTEGCTPLHFAAANGHLDVLVFLLDQGADYQKPDKHGITPLMLAESIGQMNTITALRDWDSKNPPIDQSVFSSTSSYIVAAPNNIKSKRSLQGFLPRPWKGSLLNQLFPRRSRSSTSIRRLSIGSEKRGNLGSENSSTALGSEASQLDLNMSPRSGRPYQDNSRDSSFSSFGSSLGLTRTHESRNSVTTWENGKDRARMLTGLSIQEDRKWGSEARTGTPEGMKGVMPVQEGEAAVEIGLETSGANILAGESSLQLDCKANDSYPDEISEDQPVGVSNVVQEHTEDDCGENSALWEQAVTGDLASPPPAKLRQSPISQFMPANEIVRHLTEHRCQDITDRLDASSCGSQPVSWGGFGEVFFGNLLDGTEVAIKTARDLISPSDESRKSLKDAARELYIWSKCRHPNVLPLLGLAVFRGRLGMVSLWMESGSLLSYLAKHPDTDRCKMSAQICDGVSYLHRADVGIIHGDLKGANVVISSDGTPMLTDFGNAVLQEYTLSFTETTQKNSVSARWTAPELLHGATYSMPADVYALGMTILEAITGMVPFSDRKHIAVLAAVMAHKTPARPEDDIPTNSPHGDVLWSLLKRCWDPKSAERPSAAQVAEAIWGINKQGLERIQTEERDI